MYRRDQVANLLKVSNKSFQSTMRKAYEEKTGTDLKTAIYQASRCGIHVDFASPADLVQLFTGTLLGQGGILDKRVCVFGGGSGGLQIACAVGGARSSSGYSALSNIWIDPSHFHRVRDILGIPVSRCNQGYGSILDLTDVPHDAEIVIVLSRHLASSDLETLLFLVASNHSVTRLMVSTSSLGPRVLALLNEAKDPNTDRLWKASGLFNSDRRHVFEIFSRRPTHLAPLLEQTRTLSFPTDLAVSAIMIGELRRTLAFNGTCEETSEDMDLMTNVHIGKSLDSDGFSDVRCMSAGGFGHVVTYTKRNQEGVLKLSANPYPSNRSI